MKAGAHFARGHGELFVLDLAQTFGVAVDLDVVRRVRDRHLSLVRTEQGHVGGLGEGISTQQPVLAELPQVAQVADDLFLDVLRLQIRIRRRLLEHQVDLRGAEACEFDLEVLGDQDLHLAFEDVEIPAREQADLVVCDHIGTLVGDAPSRCDPHRNRCHSQLQRRKNATVAAQDHFVLVDQNGRCETEPTGAGRDLRQLLVGVRAWVGRPGLEVSG